MPPRRRTNLPLLLLVGTLAPVPLSAQTQLWSAPAAPSARPADTGSARALRAGDSVMAFSGGGWYRATVLDAGPAGYKVRYEGWGSGWDEWLPTGRLRLPGGGAIAPPSRVPGPSPVPSGPPGPTGSPRSGQPTQAAHDTPASDRAAAIYRAGDQVWVTWTGTSHRAHILQVRGGHYLIHYDGYDSKWDEWVGPGRIRGRVEGAAAQSGPSGASQSAHQGRGSQGRAGSRLPVGSWECVTWDAGQLNRIGGFTLAAGGSYTDLNSRKSGRYSFRESDGRISFTSGPQKVDAPVTFNPDARKGQGQIVFDYGGGAKLDCHRAAR